jgi:DNA-binding protein H-NS
MAKINLGSMSLKELLELEREVPTIIAEKQKAERAELKAKLTALAAEAGLSLEDVVGNGRKGKGARSGAPVKYRNPENADETWSGRGRMANWLRDRLNKRGAKIEDYAV